jgi:hypothetical protein
MGNLTLDWSPNDKVAAATSLAIALGLVLFVAWCVELIFMARLLKPENE